MIFRKVKSVSVVAPSLLFLALLLVPTSSLKPQPPSSLPSRPKLVVVLVIDQFRYDYLMRFRPYFVKGGFNRLLERGAVFGDCRYNDATTITGPGHATLMTGAYPNVHGIIENEWYEPQQQRRVYCVEDAKTQLVGNDSSAGASVGFSPRNLVGSTLGDELRMASGFRSKVIAISLKDRAAVLMGGHDPSGAYWYDPKSGHFVTSTYYVPKLPDWAEKFSRDSPIGGFCGKKWSSETPGADGKVLAEFKPASGESCPSAKFLGWIYGTPFMNEQELAFASAAVRGEKLGHGPDTDLLAVSLSVNDYIGHRFGPNSDEVADTILRTDRDLAGFFEELDRQVGLNNVWIALSADHGVAPTPEYIQQHRLGAGVARPDVLRKDVEAALDQTFGAGPWIEAQDEASLYLNRSLIQSRNLEESRVERAAAQAAEANPEIEVAFTRSQLLAGDLPPGALGRRAANSFNLKRSGDVFLIFAPYAVPTAFATGTTHGTPWSYDAQVPLIFLGAPFKPGFYAEPCEPTDLAATLAATLGLTQPSGSEGVPLVVSLK